MRVLNEGDILQPKRSVSGIDYTLTRLELFRICKEEGFIQDQHDFDMKAVVELIDSEMKRWHEIDNPDAVKKRAESMPWEEGNVIDWPEIIPYLHTRNNVVENNELYRVAEILEDGSAINVSGAGNGNIIRRNYIHHIYNSYIHGAIRTDDYQRCATFEENIIYKTRSCGF